MAVFLRSVVAVGLVGLSFGCSQSDASGVAEDDAKGLTTAAKLAKAGAKPCDSDPSFACVTLPMPLDHFGAPAGKTIGVTFAVHAAKPSKRQGLLVGVTGGPGYSGVAGATTWKDVDPRIAETFDIVWFDLRGVLRSGGMECPKAAATFYQGGLRSATDAEDRALVAKSKAFAAACVAEVGKTPDELQHYETRQAIEDLERFRKFLGDAKFTLYGLSYGTQFSQTYAAKHPDRLRALVLDGVVDLTLDHVGYMRNLNHGIAALLDRTFDACANEAACAGRFASAPGPEARAKMVAAYDALAAKLDAAPATLLFRKKDGSTEPRRFTRADLDTTTFNAVGGADTRRALMEALAAAAKTGDLLPLLALSYEASGVDPETAGPNGTAAADPDMSNAIYYAFTCNDYGKDAAGEDARIERYLAGGRALRQTSTRLLSPYYGDLPCMSWPVARDAAPMGPLRFDGIPVVVVNATGDGATPVAQGEAVASRIADGYAITVDGGRHVMFGRGVACVDSAVANFIVNGKRPARATRCADAMLGP